MHNIQLITKLSYLHSRKHKTSLVRHLTIITVRSHKLSCAHANIWEKCLERPFQSYSKRKKKNISFFYSTQVDWHIEKKIDTTIWQTNIELSNRWILNTSALRLKTTTSFKCLFTFLSDDEEFPMKFYKYFTIDRSIKTH